MPTYSFAREAQAASVDTLYTLTGDFAGGTAANIMVPQGCSRIYQISATAGFGATAQAATMGLRISGSGVARDQNMVLVGANNIGTSVTGSAMPIVVDVDIPVVPGGTITLEGFCGGGDTGTPEIGASLLMR